MSEEIEAYLLCWPPRFTRTAQEDRESARFSRRQTCRPQQTWERHGDGIDLLRELKGLTGCRWKKPRRRNWVD